MLNSRDAGPFQKTGSPWFRQVRRGIVLPAALRSARHCATDAAASLRSYMEIRRAAPEPYLRRRHDRPGELDMDCAHVERREVQQGERRMGRLLARYGRVAV